MIRALARWPRRRTLAERLDRVAPECPACVVARQWPTSEALEAHRFLAHGVDRRRVAL